jgi:hypothetical protein
MNPLAISAMIAGAVELVDQLSKMYAEAKKNSEASPEELAAADAAVDAAHAALQDALKTKG